MERSENDCSYFEYKNVDKSGNLIDTSSRASFSHQATDAEVEAYMTPEFIFSKFSDVSFDYNAILNGAAEPSNFNVSATGFTWDGDDKAAGYLIYKDGVFVDMTQSLLTQRTLTTTLHTP